MSASRIIRVYLASSYRDMKAERELLYTTVFPQIQARCEERGLSIEVIDLRISASSEFEALSSAAAGAALLPADPSEIQSTLRIKEVVRRSGLPVFENYANPAELCARVAADLTRAVDNIVSNAPATRQLSPEQLEQLLSASRGPLETSASQEADPGDVAPTLSPSVASETPPAAVPGRRVRIVHLSGSRARTTQEFSLASQNEVWIGRDPVSHVRYAEGDQPVSRAHAKIVASFADPNAYILVSRGRNGTLINNTEVSGSGGLHDGDIVQVGRGGPAFRFEQFPKMAAQEGWQEPEPTPILAPAYPQDEPGRRTSATTVLAYDPVIAKALMEAAKKPEPATPLITEETDSIVFTPLRNTRGGNAARHVQTVFAIVIVVLVTALIIFLFSPKR